MTLWCVAHQAPLPQYCPGKNAGVGCHFLLQGSSRPRDWTCVSYIGRQILYPWASREAPIYDTNNKRWKGCGAKGTVLHFWWECKLVQSLWKMVWKFLKKLKIKPPYDSGVPLLGMHRQKSMYSLIAFPLVLPWAEWAWSQERQIGWALLAAWPESPGSPCRWPGATWCRHRSCHRPLRWTRCWWPHLPLSRRRQKNFHCHFSPERMMLAISPASILMTAWFPKILTQVISKIYLNILCPPLFFQDLKVHTVLCTRIQCPDRVAWYLGYSQPAVHTALTAVGEAGCIVQPECSWLEWSRQRLRFFR